MTVSAASSTRRQTALRRCGFALLYVFFILGFSEALARAVLRSESVLRRVGMRSSAGWRLSWLERRVTDNQIYYSFDQYHPTRGWASKPLVREADTFGPDTVNTNSAWLRGTREVELSPPDGKPRILVVGDSFTFGDEVRDEEAYPHVLGALVPEAEVVNFGVHGYGHDQMLLMLREQSLDYQPDLVVLGFVRDDMERNLLDFRDYAKPRFEVTGDRLSLRNVPVPKPDEVVRRSRWRPRLLDLLTIVRDSYFWTVGLAQRRMNALTTALLDEMVDEAVAAGAVLAFVYLPHSEEITVPDLETPGYEFFRDYCATRAAFCLDLLPEFREAVAEGQPIKPAGHWHRSGHRLVAERLADYIRERNLLKL